MICTVIAVEFDVVFYNRSGYNVIKNAERSGLYAKY